MNAVPEPSPGDLSRMDADGALAFAGQVLTRRRQAEVDDLRIAAHWAALHSADPRWGIPELAMVRQVHPISGQALMADVLDLQHRLPLTWERVSSLEAEAWVARKVASMSRDVPLATIGVVDRAVSKIIAGEAPSRVLTVAQAKVMEADPVTQAKKEEAARRRRFVALSRIDENGLQNVIARVAAGDARWVDALVGRVADLLTGDHPEGTPRDELRSIAFGWLARPAELLELLTGQQTEPVAAKRERRRRKVVIYVHLHEAALEGGRGVARVQGVGPFAMGRLRELLGHADITVKPVRDLADRVRLTSYEHPDELKERVRLITDGDRFPFCGSEGAGADFDHPTPYRSTGPPGQTGTHNSQPLGRRHHRWKTHAGFSARQCGDGRYVWRTPHGRYFLVDHRGTLRLPASQGELIHDAPPGLGIYLPAIDLRTDFVRNGA